MTYQIRNMNILNILKEDGCFIISEGTFRIQDLLPKYLNILRDIAPEEYQQLMIPACGFSCIPSYVLEDEDDEWWNSESAAFLMESIIDIISNHTPEGYYFGSHEGDGACIGFWSNSDESL